MGATGLESGLTVRLRELFRLAEEEMSAERTAMEWLPLTPRQVAELESGGSRSGDWSRVMVSPGSDLTLIELCRFQGDVRLDLRPTVRQDGSRATPFLSRSTLEDTETGPGCRVISTGLVRGIRIGRGAVIERCGRVTFQPGSGCGSGSILHLGVETGERGVGSFPLLDVETAALLSGGAQARAAREDYAGLLEAFLNRLRNHGSGTIGDFATLLDTAVIEDSFLGPGVLVSGACGVRASTLLGGGHPSRVTDGALVRGSILKWGASVDSMALVEGSVVDEAATVERHGKLLSSLLGPNGVLAEGEITATLAGPFTAAHHQSLLIAAWWPEGRGNLGYGANVGSNHTSRLADQEIRPGEGMFFGLGCSIKYPSDFSRAPYSIVATGVTTLPQRVDMPFSLICAPFSEHGGIPHAFNQILPAWVLSSSLYSVIRNDLKFRLRNRALRGKGAAGVIRRETLDLMAVAASALEAAVPAEIHLSDSIPGLGSNFLLEEDRLAAVETYRFHMGFHALRQLAALMENGGSHLELMETSSSTDPDWAHSREWIRSLYPGDGEEKLLTRLRSMWEKAAADVEESRARDFSRGVRIIGDYAEFHAPPAEDPVVLGFREEATAAGKILDRLLRAGCF
jgi:hypothetical protein